VPLQSPEQQSPLAPHTEPMLRHACWHKPVPVLQANVWVQQVEAAVQVAKSCTQGGAST
jgi:hypothetical protein